MAKTGAQLDAEIAELLRAPRVVNREKLAALLRHHARAAEAWREEADAWKRSSREVAADERRRALELAKAHDRIGRRIMTAASKDPGKLVELSRLELAPEDLHMTEVDVWGADE